MRGLARCVAGAVMAGAAWATATGPAAAAPARAVVERVIPVGGLGIRAVPSADGGVVTVASPVTASGDTFTTAARRPDGRVLWSRTRTAGCGNCDAGPQPLGLQPDGTVGPIGYTGDDAWAYDPAGREVRACRGSLGADGLCVVAEMVIEFAPEFAHRPGVLARRGGAVRWRADLRPLRWATDSDAPAGTVRDRAGRAYAAFPRSTSDAGPPGAVADRVVAVAVADGAVLWRAEGPERVVAGLGRGVLAWGAGRLTAYDPAGAPRWERPSTGIAEGEVRVDTRRGRVVVPRLSSRDRVHALAAGDGRILWATPARDSTRLLETDGRGRTYVAVDGGPRRGLAVRDGAGRPVLRFATRARVTDAVPMAGGRVAVVVQARGAAAGRLVIVRAPRRCAVRHAGHAPCTGRG